MFNFFSTSIVIEDLVGFSIGNRHFVKDRGPFLFIFHLSHGFELLSNENPLDGIEGFNLCNQVPILFRS